MPWWNMQHMRGFNPETFFLSGQFLPFLVPVMLWSLIWKGMALYKAARNEHKYWFVILLVVNTVGILEIVYLLFFSTPKPAKKKK